MQCEVAIVYWETFGYFIIVFKYPPARRDFDPILIHGLRESARASRGGHTQTKSVYILFVRIQNNQD